MSDYSVCTQCGAEIEESGIHFRGYVFCSDACCEEYETEFQDKDEPGIDELDPEETSLDNPDDDFGYREKEGFDDSELDDEYEISPDDF